MESLYTTVTTTTTTTTIHGPNGETITPAEYAQKKEEWRHDVKKEKVNLVMNQTNYNEEEAERALNENDWNCMRAIQTYMSPKSEPETPKQSVNQMIYKEIRTMMDSASMNYYRQKEIDRYLQERASTSTSNNKV